MARGSGGLTVLPASPPSRRSRVLSRRRPDFLDTEQVSTVDLTTVDLTTVDLTTVDLDLTDAALAAAGPVGTVVTDRRVVGTWADGSDVVAPQGVYLTIVKPVIDRSAAYLMLLLLSPLIGVVALAIRVKLGKGVIYRQQRVGRGGTPFTIYKFRTMLADRRTGGQDRREVLRSDSTERRQTHKSENDPRHTPLGRLLRKTSLDELPQLWNVARGQMSLVGPRPELVTVVDRYDLWQHDRHLVLPGITGLWQVSERHTTAMHEATGLDIEYVARFSWRLDLQILARTAGALRRGGS